MSLYLMRTLYLPLLLAPLLAGCATSKQTVATKDLASATPENIARWKRLERALIAGTLKDASTFVGKQVSFVGGRTYGGYPSITFITTAVGNKTVTADVEWYTESARNVNRLTTQCLDEVERTTAPMIYVSVSGTVVSIDKARRKVHITPHLVGIRASF